MNPYEFGRLVATKTACAQKQANNPADIRPTPVKQTPLTMSGNIQPPNISLTANRSRIPGGNKSVVTQRQPTEEDLMPPAARPPVPAAASLAGDERSPADYGKEIDAWRRSHGYTVMGNERVNIPPLGGFGGEMAEDAPIKIPRGLR